MGDLTKPAKNRVEMEIVSGSEVEDFKLKLFANLRSVLEGGPDVPEDLLSEFRKAFDLSDDAGVAEIINAIDLLEATNREMRLTREARLAKVEE